jgi:hypothetical protein
MGSGVELIRFGLVLEGVCAGRCRLGRDRL